MLLPDECLKKQNTELLSVKSVETRKIYTVKKIAPDHITVNLKKKSTVTQDFSL